MKRLAIHTAGSSAAHFAEQGGGKIAGKRARGAGPGHCDGGRRRRRRRLLKWRSGGDGRWSFGLADAERGGQMGGEKLEEEGGQRRISKRTSKKMA